SLGLPPPRDEPGRCSLPRLSALRRRVERVPTGLLQRVQQRALFAVELRLAHGPPHGFSSISFAISFTKSLSLRGCSLSTASKAIFHVSLTKCNWRRCCLAESSFA